MSNIVNIPPCKVWVRKEYLTDHHSGYGEFVEGYWVTAKSLPGRTFYFETYLPAYAAMYDKRSMGFQARTKRHGMIGGKYLFTLDNLHENIQQVDCNVSEVPQEHKSFNCLELENGQYCLYPNNRMRIYDVSLSPKDVKIPDFKVSTEYYEVENPFSDWGTLGDTEEYFWKTENEE